ncbi:SubName: Full=Uncharacterized protein {ECO:0000313/EMBL:CCA77879.1} [Serendipita indica DSM 11827]|nr:SubName: Full=Uncharacterized protein {ECO:0000313/EMBL:CCA77879.1} [Serendipita indica DSM 11827]
MTTIALNITSTSSSFVPSVNSTTTTHASSSHSQGFVPWWTGDWRYWFYFLAHSIGGAGLSLLLLTMCLPLRRVRRNPVLISMCFSWWLGSFPNLTLLFFTNNVLGSPPSHATCLASAALTMAQTPLNAVCAVMLVYNVWSVLHFTSAQSNTGKARTVLLVLIPYVVFLICAGVVVTVGVIRPELVARATFYCVVRSNVLTIFLGIFGGVCCVVAIILEAWIAFLLRSNKKSASRNHAPYDDSKNSTSSSKLDLQLAIRVMLFGFYIFAGLALSIVSILNWTSVIPDLCFSTFSIAVFAIFGSQHDVVRVWKKAFCCCFIRSEQRGRRTASHVRTGSHDSRDGKMGPGAIGPYSPGGKHNGAYWYRGADKKRQEIMGDLNTLHTRQTTSQTASFSGGPYNSHTDFQFQYESDVGMGLVGNASAHPDHRGGKKSKDAWWGGEKKNGRPGTGNSSKRPGTAGSAKRPGTAGSNFGETSMSWYPDLGYDFHPEGTSHTADYEIEMDIAHTSANVSEVAHQPADRKDKEGMRRKSQHANPHTRHSSATVPSEYIGTSPRSPAFIYYDPNSPTSTTEPVPALVPSTSLSPASTSLLSPTSTSPLGGGGSSPLALASAAANMAGVIQGKDGVKTATGQGNFSFPMKPPKGRVVDLVQVDGRVRVADQDQQIHTPQLSTRGYTSNTDLLRLPRGGIRNTIAAARKELQHSHQDSFVAEGGSHYNFRDSDQYSQQFVRDSLQYRDSTDANGVPTYYLREYSHTYMHSTDYRSSLDSSVGGGARAAIKNGVEPYVDPGYTGAHGPTTLYDSNYPYSYDFSTGLPSPVVGDAPPRHYGYTHHANVSTPHRAVVGHEDHEVYAPVPKTAFEKEHSGFEFISGRKRTGGANSPESFLTNPSLMNGRVGHGY